MSGNPGASLSGPQFPERSFLLPVPFLSMSHDDFDSVDKQHCATSPHGTFDPTTLGTRHSTAAHSKKHIRLLAVHAHAYVHAHVWIYIYMYMDMCCLDRYMCMCMSIVSDSTCRCPYCNQKRSGISYFPSCVLFQAVDLAGNG